MTVSVEPGTVVVYTDVVCAWSTVALHRFYAERDRAGLTDRVRVDHRLFLLEDVNTEPQPKRLVDGEIGVVGALAPELGWKPWQGDASTWPITSLLANEAVHAAKAQSLAAAEELDMALRLAFFAHSRPISMLHEVVDVAGTCELVDVEALRQALEDGRARGPMMRDYREHVGEVRGSPHFFLADGSDAANPGIELEWIGDAGAGFPLVRHDDPGAMAELVARAAGGA